MGHCNRQPSQTETTLITASKQVTGEAWLVIKQLKFRLDLILVIRI